MVVVRICVGSSCHLKGSQAVVDAFEKEVAARNLDGEVVLTGSFCIGKCNREGVSVQVDDDVFVGVTPQGALAFFEREILSRVQR